MSFQLSKLPWAENALEPHISAGTIQFHYGKHHAAYVNKLNELTKGTEWEKKDLEDVVRQSEGTIFNQAAQAWNHAFYWQSMAAKAGGEPTGAIKSQIEKDFGSFQAFKEKFSAVAAGHFGSGWAWLIFDKASKTLKVHQGHDAGNPLKDGSGIPILTCDVWEHAYYIDYRNARPKYVEAWWNLINWDFANANLKKACM